MKLVKNEKATNTFVQAAVSRIRETTKRIIIAKSIAIVREDKIGKNQVPLARVWTSLHTANSFRLTL